MTDIFKEVEEDVRREQAMKLARRYGPYAAGAIVLLLVLVGGHQAYEAYRTKKMEDAAGAYLDASALAEKDDKGAAQAFAALAAKGGGYGLLARFREAQALERSGDTGGAAKVLDQIAADSRVDKTLAGLAALKSGYLQLDRLTRADLEARLLPLTAKDNPWRFPARELLAFAALKSGEQAKAIADFKALALDLESPQGIRARAGSMVEALGGSLAPPPAAESPTPVQPAPAQPAPAQTAPAQTAPAQTGKSAPPASAPADKGE